MVVKELWLLVGREFDGNYVKHYFVRSNNGACKQLTYKQFVGFANQHNVINAKVSGQGGLKGVGVDLNLIPRYKRVNGQLIQYGGVQEAEIVRLAQPVIQKLYEKQQADVMKREQIRMQRQQVREKEQERRIIKRQTEEEKRAIAQQKAREKQMAEQQRKRAERERKAYLSEETKQKMDKGWDMYVDGICDMGVGAAGIVAGPGVGTKATGAVKGIIGQAKAGPISGVMGASAGVSVVKDSRGLSAKEKAQLAGEAIAYTGKSAVNSVASKPERMQQGLAKGAKAVGAIASSSNNEKFKKTGNALQTLFPDDE